jgi:tRNA nucleotidyltransferase/poly(A) polymerase
MTNWYKKFAQSSEHKKSIILMKFISNVTNKLGAGDSIYVVGGAVRNFILGKPIKDIDIVIDSVALGEGKDSAWLADNIVGEIPVKASIATNQYGVAIITIKDNWIVDGENFNGEVIEIANARKESYGKNKEDAGKGYKPTEVSPATIQEDLARREFTFNTLLWKMSDLSNGPDTADTLDITGRGVEDLKNRIIRTPSDPDTTFHDDPTRILRAIKFMGKYGFRLSPEVEQSIVINAPSMKNAPWEAIGTILVENILNEPNAHEMFREMKRLGLVSVIEEMITENQPFATYLKRQMQNNRSIDLLKELFETSIIDVSVLGFLRPEQRMKLKTIIDNELYLPNSPERFISLLQKPLIDNSQLMIEHPAISKNPKVLGIINQSVKDYILDNPDVAGDAIAIMNFARTELDRII